VEVFHNQNAESNLLYTVMQLNEAHPVLKLGKKKYDSVSAEVELRGVLILELSAHYESEAMDPFDEDNPGTASIRRRYYNNPDYIGVIEIEANLSPSDVPSIIDDADFSMTVGEFCNAAAIGTVQFIHKALDLASSEDKETYLKIYSDGGFHPAFKAELEKLIVPTFKLKTGSSLHKEKKAEVLTYDFS